MKQTLKAMNEAQRAIWLKELRFACHVMQETMGKLADCLEDGAADIQAAGDEGFNEDWDTEELFSGALGLFEKMNSQIDDFVLNFEALADDFEIEAEDENFEVFNDAIHRIYDLKLGFAEEGADE